MSFHNYTKNKLSSLLQKHIAANKPIDLTQCTVKKVLVVRQHNQFGDQLASVSLLRAIKETYPDSSITLIASKENYYAVQKNKYIDELIIFNKKKFWHPNYFFRFKKILKQNFDLAVVPATVAISTTSCIIAGISDAKIKVGPKSLNGKGNDFAFIFHHQIDLDWRKHPDAHVSDFILDIVRPLGIKTKNYSTSIFYDEDDIKAAKKFLNTFKNNDFKYVIGFHIGAGKPANRWPLENYVELIKRLKTDYKIKYYFTGSSADREELNYVKNHFGNEAGYFINKTIPQLAALISISSLFITNDTGVMHVAGATDTPQISIFGPTNPFNWAPVGSQKYFIRKSELINEVSVDDVYNLFLYLLKKHFG